MLQQWKARIRKLPRHRGLEERRLFNRYVRSLRNERSSLRDERISLRDERSSLRDERSSLRAGFGNNKIPSIIDAGRNLETLLTKKLVWKDNITFREYQNTLKTTLYHIHNYITQFINVYTLIRTGYTLKIREDVIRRIEPYKDVQTVLDCYNAWLKDNNISDKEASETFTPEALEYVRTDTPLKKYYILFQYIGFLLFLRDGTNNNPLENGDAPIVATCMLKYLKSKQEIKPEEEIKVIFYRLFQDIKSRSILTGNVKRNVEKSSYGLAILFAMMQYKSLQECIDEFCEKYLKQIESISAVESLRIVNEINNAPERERNILWWNEEKNVYKRR